MIKDKLCIIIIDNGSYNNIASQELVVRMGLKQWHHLSPYKIQWLNECGMLCVSNIVTVPFFIGRYNDHVECDVGAHASMPIAFGKAVVV